MAGHQVSPPENFLGSLLNMVHNLVARQNVTVHHVVTAKTTATSIISKSPVEVVIPEAVVYLAQGDVSIVPTTISSDIPGVRIIPTTAPTYVVPVTAAGDPSTKSSNSEETTSPYTDPIIPVTVPTSESTLTTPKSPSSEEPSTDPTSATFSAPSLTTFTTSSSESPTDISASPTSSSYLASETTASTSADAQASSGLTRSSNHTGMYIGIGVGAALLSLLLSLSLFFLLRRHRRKKSQPPVEKADPALLASSETTFETPPNRVSTSTIEPPPNRLSTPSPGSDFFGKKERNNDYESWKTGSVPSGMEKKKVVNSDGVSLLGQEDEREVTETDAQMEDEVGRAANDGKNGNEGEEIGVAVTC